MCWNMNKSIFCRVLITFDIPLLLDMQSVSFSVGKSSTNNGPTKKLSERRH